ncbi:MAG TPA: DUF1453 domain-containing protein [Verrucomicrobiae bacterium]|jgi:hypothetical protein|nr:DUF1453 domain-containing protein [Verrucomicrobiae bacterium]
MPSGPNSFAPLVIVVFIAWRVFYRVRRSIGKQTVRKKRLVARIVIYSVLGVASAVGGLFRPIVLAGLGVGLLLGVPLALVGLRLTRFENALDRQFYTPNPYIGAAVSLLFIIRLFYRISEISGAAAQGPRPPASMLSPLTFGLFGLLAGYYLAYYSGILLRCRAVPI